MAKKQSKSIYLISPLIAGFFLALGYGIAHRAWILMGDWQPTSRMVFRSKQSPGKALEQLLVPIKEVNNKAFNSNEKQTNHLFDSNQRKVTPSLNDFAGTSSIKTQAEPTKINTERVKIPNSSQNRNEPVFTKENFDAVIRALPES